MRIYCLPREERGRQVEHFSRRATARIHSRFYLSGLNCHEDCGTKRNWLAVRRTQFVVRSVIRDLANGSSRAADATVLRLLVRRLRRLRHYASRTISARQMRGILMRERKRKGEAGRAVMGTNPWGPCRRNVDRDRVLEKVRNGAAPPFAFGQGAERNKLGEHRSDFQLGMYQLFPLRRGADAARRKKRYVLSLKRGLLLIASCLTLLVSRHPRRRNWRAGRAGTRKFVVSPRGWGRRTDSRPDS